MKKIVASTVLLVIIVGLSVSCKKIVTRVFDGFDASVPEIVVTIPTLQPPFPGFPVPDQELEIGSFRQSFNLDSTIKANTGGTFSAKDVNTVKIKKIDVTILNSDANNNLSNFKSARINFSSNTITTPVEVASFDFPDVNSATQTYTAPANAPELIGYLNGSEIIYTVKGKLRKYTTKPITLSTKVTITVL